VEVDDVASRTTDLYTRAQVSTALLSAADAIAAEFPHVPHSVVYEKVGDARAIAARRLPNVAAYRQVLEREARLALTGYGSGSRPEMSPGTSGLTSAR
jgi:hypothetical protein